MIKNIFFRNNIRNFYTNNVKNNLTSNLTTKNIFINAVRSDKSKMVGIGIYSAEFMYSLRFLEIPNFKRNDKTLLLHNMCSIIFLHNEKEKRICDYLKNDSINYNINPFFNLNNDEMPDMVPYLNTFYRIFHNVNYFPSFHKSNPSDIGHVMSLRLAKHASNTCQSGIRKGMKLHNGEIIRFDYLFCD